ncbi:hypothetical protein dsat_1138 [Alkalidesulfovibrio alkalitolerans DSM 16529]|jgi:uncharacterized membrane protein|uniref:Uncharacterized protein n=1 Tax=Alkalidesulfovibrio alkalitolerans DSM 16529 TaxID=1121439 RepID=S7T345_9BACT|nr:hypothetical protein [Alkalidesulfovibrio alkalitolerans]EPR31011.1 hypothetical protein dsat_1138 [Alkalidesulfovibrio alkalitolerans DSM 16529]
MNKKDITDYLARGILIGGSLGVVAGLLFTTLERGLFLGMLCGAFAGATLYTRSLKKKK